MGVYTEKFRELIATLPNTPDKFENQVHASSVCATIVNATLQVVASLEEALEDAQKENERLQEMLMERESATAGEMPSWWPTKK